VPEKAAVDDGVVMSADGLLALFVARLAAGSARFGLLFHSGGLLRVSILSFRQGVARFIGN
jgi:hypothetical protein